MGISHYVALLILTPVAIWASRVNRTNLAKHNDKAAQGMAKLCKLTETDHAKGYGIKGAFPVKSCIQECQFNRFFLHTLEEKCLAEPDEEGETCKCNYAPRYWEGAGSNKHWFQFRKNKLHSECTKSACKTIFYDWGNIFLKKMFFPGDNERMDITYHLQNQANYDLTCEEGIPEAIVLPPPGKKIHELRMLIAQTDDPEEKAKLQALLDELLGGKEVELFEYDLEADWGPERHADDHGGPDLHSFYLKPCKSNLGNEVTELKDILEQCGPWTKDESMKEGKVRYSYHADEPWGPERIVEDTPSMQTLKELVSVPDGLKLLSFRLKPCKSPSGDREVTEIDDILSEEYCHTPVLRTTLLPVKVSAAHKFDPTAPEDDFKNVNCEEK